jgi:hypothetical protein
MIFKQFFYEYLKHCYNYKKKTTAVKVSQPNFKSVFLLKLSLSLLLSLIFFYIFEIFYLYAFKLNFSFSLYQFISD